MPTIMKRLFNKPMPKEIGSFQHFKARQQAQSDPASWHPVQAICVVVGALSLLTLASVVLLQIIAAAGPEMPPVGFLLRLDAVMYASSAVFFACVGVLAAFNRFRRAHAGRLSTKKGGE